MFRKFMLAAGATAVLGAAALAPTSASAWGHNHHGHWGHYGHGFGVGFYSPTYVAAPDCYVVRRVVYTPYGKRFRRVTVCD